MHRRCGAALERRFRARRVVENSVVFDEERLLNPEGLRYADECARHKVLDVVGDLALAGLPLLGAFARYAAATSSITPS